MKSALPFLFVCPVLLAFGATSQASPPLDNAGVENLARFGIGEAELLQIIAKAPQVAFDLTPEGEAWLLKDHISERVIKAMAARELSVAWDAPAPAEHFAPAAPPTVAKKSDADKHSFPVVALRSAVRQYERSFDFTLPGNVRTSCYGSWTSVSCSSWITPPTDVPVNIAWTEVDQQVAAGITTYTLSCRAHWVGSACMPLVDGDTFLAQLDGSTMRITGRKGGNQGKELRTKFRVLDMR